MTYGVGFRSLCGLWIHRRARIQASCAIPKNQARAPGDVPSARVGAVRSMITPVECALAAANNIGRK